jgi:hypothetical protein
MEDVSSIYSHAVLMAEEGVRHDSAGDLGLAIESYEAALSLIHQGSSLDKDEEQRLHESATKVRTPSTALRACVP